jgi:hypothetical protein
LAHWRIGVLVYWRIGALGSGEKGLGFEVGRQSIKFKSLEVYLVWGFGVSSAERCVTEIVKVLSGRLDFVNHSQYPDTEGRAAIARA